MSLASPGRYTSMTKTNTSKVIFDISLSLDGFITGANPRPEAPLGDGGERFTSGRSETTSATVCSSPMGSRVSAP